MNEERKFFKFNFIRTKKDSKPKKIVFKDSDSDNEVNTKNNNKKASITKSEFCFANNRSYSSTKSLLFCL